MKHLNLVLFEPDDQSRLRKAQLLMRKGLAVFPCASAAELYDILDRAQPDSASGSCPVFAVFIRSQAHPRALLDDVLKRLRMRFRVILIVESSDGALDRSKLLESGADVCVAPGCPPTELVAVVRAMHKFFESMLVRDRHSVGSACEVDHRLILPEGASMGGGERLVQRHRLNDKDLVNPSIGDVSRYALERIDTRLATGHGYGASERAQDNHAKAYGEWLLSFQDWVLVNPRGVHIGLTGVERNFFEALLRNERRELSRKSIGDNGLAFKSISVIVSRMRKKIGLAGCPLPLHTVHGRGYVFIGTLNRAAAA